ncbi:MAG: hypothetical protein ACTSPD_05250 [Promethearchaeota archaeon]
MGSKKKLKKKLGEFTSEKSVEVTGASAIGKGLAKVIKRGSIKKGIKKGLKEAMENDDF